MYGKDAGQLLVLLGLRQLLLQCLRERKWQPQQRQRLAHLTEVGLTEMQLQAAAEMVAHRCIDSAKVTLHGHALEVKSLRAGQLVDADQAGALDVRGQIAGVDLAVVQLQACPGDPTNMPFLEEKLLVGAWGALPSPVSRGTGYAEVELNYTLNKLQLPCTCYSAKHFPVVVPTNST